MIYLAYFILVFTFIRFGVALYNFIFNPVLKTRTTDKHDLVSVLIPARNEENNIGHILGDLSGHDYVNLEIIVHNDQSTDKTKEIVKQFQEKDSRIQLINATDLPQGWLGKNYGCYRLAQSAKGKYLLFLDADVRIKNGLVHSAIHHLEKHQLSMFSIFPKQEIMSLGEKISVPIMNVILLTLLPLRLVRTSNYSSLSAANGQFMFFDAKAYQRYKPHQKFKNNKVEDIFTSRYFKKNKQKIDCLLGNYSITCRMYNNYMDAVLGFTKNVAAFFGNSYLLAIMFWLITTFGIFIIVLTLSFKYLLIYIVTSILIRIFVSSLSRQNILENVIYLIPQQITLGNILFFAIRNNMLKKNKWKERPID